MGYGGFGGLLMVGKESTDKKTAFLRMTHLKKGTLK